MKLRQYPEGIFSVINGIVAGVGETMGGFLNGFSEGLSSGQSQGASEGVLSGMMDRMKVAMGFGVNAPVVAHAAVREPEIGPTGPTTKENHVSMAELGTFSAPQLPQNVSRGGMSMNA
jgi:hypothetical protein